MTKHSFAPHRVTQLRALHDSVLVTDMVFDRRITSSGLILPSDDGKGTGIRPRWGQVYAVGRNHRDVRPGQWILVAHGRWTRGIDIQDDDGIKTLRKIDPRDILLVSDSKPADDTMSDAIHIEPKTR
jgi:co-chaperonin GroES (HSP10)